MKFYEELNETSSGSCLFDSCDDSCDSRCDNCDDCDSRCDYDPCGDTCSHDYDDGCSHDYDSGCSYDHDTCYRD